MNDLTYCPTGMIFDDGNTYNCKQYISKLENDLRLKDAEIWALWSELEILQQVCVRLRGKNKRSTKKS